MSYWYFYKSNVTSLVLDSESKKQYTVELKWVFHYKYFPIFDKAFFYQSTCTGSCIFSPIPPIEYEISITSTGSESIYDTLTIPTGDTFTYKFHLTPSLLFGEEKTFVIDNSSLLWTNLIGYTQWGKRVAFKDQGESIVSLYVWEKNNPNFSFSVPFQSLFLDRTKNYLIVESQRSEQYIYSLDGQNKIIFPFSERIEIVSQLPNWKIRTINDIYEYSEGTWKKNPRFTDYIDISSRYRIGYIDKKDQKKLSLQNLPLDESLFFLVDRTSTSSKIIKRWKDIQGFFFYEWRPVILEEGWVYRTIDINLE
jgi:hypothetical protein